MTRVSVIVPTYREAENLAVLIPQVHETMASADLDYEIIVVDDDSQDGTPEVCRELELQCRVRLITRTNERGLSSAVICGMRAATGSVFVVMDADLSHPPEKLPDLVAALAEPGVDFVIGSRYVSGGETTDDWGLFRWLNSKAATWLARPFTAARDPMAGFFAITRERFESAAQLDPIGYKIGLELIVKARCKKIVEVPIRFQDRLHGDSKLTLREQINYLKHLKRLYEFKFKGWALFAQFIAVGLTGMLVDLTAFAMLLTFVSLSWARGLAIWVAMSWNFVLNRSVTFRSARGESPVSQYFAYCLSCLLGAALNWSTSVLLCWFVPFFDEQPLLAAFTGIVAGTASNFLLCRHFVFRQKAEAAKSITSTADAMPESADNATQEHSLASSQTP